VPAAMISLPALSFSGPLNMTAEPSVSASLWRRRLLPWFSAETRAVGRIFMKPSVKPPRTKCCQGLAALALFDVVLVTRPRSTGAGHEPLGAERLGVVVAVLKMPRFSRPPLLDHDLGASRRTGHDSGPLVAGCWLLPASLTAATSHRKDDAGW